MHWNSRWCVKWIQHRLSYNSRLQTELREDQDQEYVRSLLFSALQACSSSSDLLETGKRIHSDIGQPRDLYIANTLVIMYTKCGAMDDARTVFDSMKHRNTVSWNAVISGYAKSGNPLAALGVFKEMKQPDPRSILAAIVACTGLVNTQADVDAVMSEIGVTKRHAKEDVYVASALVGLYAKCGCMDDAKFVFDSISSPSVVSWTTLIMGYVESGESHKALEAFSGMHLLGVKPDGKALVVALTACASRECSAFQRRSGIAIHQQASEAGFEGDIYVTSTLIDMYVKWDRLSEAEELFSKAPMNNVVSWTALIMGYAEKGQGEVAIQLFYRMLSEGDCAPNSRTYVAVLVACGKLVAYRTGKDVHGIVCKLGVEKDSYVYNSLLDFYGSCGSMVDAKSVFESVQKPSVVTWTALISGYSHQGDSTNVFHVLEMMNEEGVPPSSVTYISILNACSRGGLVDRGREFFSEMLHSSLDHYQCMVDILARSNRLDEALELVRSMPYKANDVTWTTLLAGCCKWKNVEVGTIALESLIEIDPKQGATYLLMSNFLWQCRDTQNEVRKNASATIQFQSWGCCIGVTDELQRTSISARESDYI